MQTYAITKYKGDYRPFGRRSVRFPCAEGLSGYLAALNRDVPLPGILNIGYQSVALQFLIQFGHAFAGKIVAAAAKCDLSVFKSNKRPDVMKGTGPGFKV